VQTDLIETLNQTGELLATYLDGRVQSAKKLEPFTGPMTISLTVDAVESLAHLLRQHSEAISDQAKIISNLTARADGAEIAVAQGMALVDEIRKCGIVELFLFSRQKGK
jgi:hypothetical protein